MHIRFTLILIAITWLSTASAQTQVPQGAGSQADNNPPVTFKFGISYVLFSTSHFPKDFGRSRNVIDLNIRNEDPSRTVIELEYEVYAVDKDGADVAQVRVVDRAKIKPLKTAMRRSVPWKPDSILQKCASPIECQISVRIVRVKFDSGAEFTGRVEPQKREPSKKPGQARDSHPLP